MKKVQRIVSMTLHSIFIIQISLHRCISNECQLCDQTQIDFCKLFIKYHCVWSSFSHRPLIHSHGNFHANNNDRRKKGGISAPINWQSSNNSKCNACKLVIHKSTLSILCVYAFSTLMEFPINPYSANILMDMIQMNNKY